MLRRSLQAAAVVSLVLAFMAVAACRASAAGPPGGTGWWPLYTPGASETRYAYYEGGKYAGKLMWAEDFHNMSERAAYGVQSIGTGVGTGYSSQAAGGVATAEKLKTLATTAGTVATVRGLKGDTLSVMSRLKSYGLLKSLGTIALAATSFEFGWKIGSSISSLFGFGKSEEKIEGTFIRNANLEKMYEAGETLPNFSGTSLNVPAPQAGGVVGFTCAPSGCGTLYVVQPHAAADSEGKCQNRQINNVPVTATFIQTEVAKESCGGKIYNLVSGVYFDPIQVKCLPGEAGCEPKTTQETAGQTPPMSGSDATKFMEECFQALVVCGRLPAWWWNHDPEAREKTVSDGTGTGLDPSDPLQVRIPAFGRHEKYTAYEAKLEALELVPEAIELPEEWANPNYGPEEVTQVNPKPTSQVEPETVVKVRFNPSTATETAPGGESEVPAEATGPWSPPSIPAIDLNPLSLPVGCNTFPFGVFCWVSEGLGSWGSGAGTCPNVAIPIHNGDLEADFCTFEPAMEIIRPVIVIMATFSLVWLFAAAAMGFGASTGGDDD